MMPVRISRVLIKRAIRRSTDLSVRVYYIPVNPCTALSRSNECVQWDPTLSAHNTKSKRAETVWTVDFPEPCASGKLATGYALALSIYIYRVGRLARVKAAWRMGS